MAKSDYLPPKDNEYLVWHDQFKTIMASNGATVGMAAGDITATTTDNTTMHTRIAAVNSTAATAAQAVVDKNTDRAATEKRARALVKRKLRQERHVYSHAVECDWASSVGAAWGCVQFGSPLHTRRGGLRSNRFRSYGASPATA